MYEINKQQFGIFLSTLRKEKGYTQQELADRLYISNKAVSKWETGISLPDVTLLLPLSETLDVSVTELLKGQRFPNTAPIDSVQVEDLVKTALSYSEERPLRKAKRRNVLIYAACMLASLCEVFFLYCQGYFPFSEFLTAALLMGILLGFYFMVAAKTKLPDYYDSNRITTYHDGPVRINLGIAQINNRNWPHIVRIFRWWSMLLLVGYPLLTFFMHAIAPQFWLEYEKIFFLISLAGGMLLPVAAVGRKYQ